MFIAFEAVLPMTALVPSLPHDLPPATLPASYESAKLALAECYRVDECKDWADKAKALASYAKQAADETLYETAQRIHGRAIKRCGELLRELPKAQGKRTDQLLPTNGGGSKEGVLGDLRISTQRASEMERIAAIPDPEFEELIEQSPPPTVTALAARGKKPATKPLHDLAGRAPADFRVATEALGYVGDFHSFALIVEPAAIARGASTKERARLAKQIAPLLGWLHDLLGAVEASK